MNEQVNNFDIEQIMKSGQCFRIREIEPKKYAVIHREYCTTITEKDNGNYTFDCTDQEMRDVWMRYFDLNTPTSEIYERIEPKIDKSDKYLMAAVEYGKGLRILRQDLWEMMVSFMISQNNNIPRIKSLIEALCERYGSRLEHNGYVYHTFPDPEALTNEKELREMGFGYRAPFIANMAENVAKREIDLSELQAMPQQLAYNYLLSILGIGPKVAACIDLFGLHHLNAFPIDTWIAKVIDREYGGKFPIEKYRGFEGVVQQYIFFYEQEQKGSK